MNELRALLESDAISEAMKTEIQEAWDAKIKENRIAITAELREEFATKYKHDKGVMVEAIDSLISEKLKEEMAELHEDRRQLAEARARYAIAMRENSKLFKNFIMESLKKEVVELRQDQKSMAHKFAVMEEFVVEQLAKELAEFYEDKQDLAETKVRLVRESKAHFNTVKANFIKRSATLIEQLVVKGLTGEIKQLKEDIEVARRNDFGRKIFEAFSSEYLNSHLNEKSEAKKLLKVLSIKDKQLAEAKVYMTKATKIAESKHAEVQKLKESQERQQVLNELIAPLSKDQKAIMSDLLETVQTNRLRSAFNKYIPAVIDGNSPEKQKAKLNEAKEITGNRENSSIKNANDHNVFDIKRLAGLK